MTIDLLHAPRQQLADEPLDELSLAVAGVERWTAHLGEIVEWVYRVITLRLLARPHAAAELEVLYDHLARLVDPARHQEIDAAAPGLRETLATYARLLDTRLEILDAQAPEEVLKRAHVADILELVAGADDGIPQAELMDRLALKKANVTRILNVLDHNELITRERVGRDNRVRLGPRAPRAAQREREETVRPSGAGPKRYLVERARS